MSNARNLAKLLVSGDGVLSTSNAPSSISAGTVAYLAMSTAPSGWLKANGAAVSRSTYATLFTAIGTTFGTGDGSTTFNIPDLRGEFIRSWDDSRGVDSGRSLGTAQGGQVQNHTHRTSGGGGLNGNSTNAGFAGAGSPNSTYNDTTNPTSGAGAETRPRNVSLLACIKF